MGWFDEQIKQRKQNDDALFSDSFEKVAGSVLGFHKESIFDSEDESISSAIEYLLKYYKLKKRELPAFITELDDILEHQLRPHGIMRRTVNLTDGWYKDAIGALLGKRKDDGSIVAFIPTGFSGYCFFNSKTGKKERITRRNADLFELEAISFYKPFPLRKLNIIDLVRYMIETLSVMDYVYIATITLIVTLVGMIVPKLNNVILSRVAIGQDYDAWLSSTLFLIAVTISSIMFNTVKTLVMSRLDTKFSLQVEAASMMRVLSLPAPFFNEFSSGELSSRTTYIQTLCNMLITNLLSIGLTSLFSLLYISQIFEFAPVLVIPSLFIILVTLIFSVVSSQVQQKITKKSMEIGSKDSGMSYALISGIQKIKLSGAEKRAFARWADLYAKGAELTYNPPMFIKINSVISVAIGLAGTIIMYYYAAAGGVKTSEYYAFNTAYGMVSGAFMEVASIALIAARIKPIVEMVQPILNAEPEIAEGREIVENLNGSIELSNISFSYGEGLPKVIDDLSLRIKPGQYLAIVGKTGCGKSTLVRLLLGFETPQKGAIYYDGKDINTLDVKSLRRKIGSVTQNGKLFQGDIYSNIVISAPSLTLDKAWEAAEIAGIAEDIREMPMGMNTLISEGQGGISGGQKQRLMIARAVAPSPKILIFDEATSALDNVTQKHVSDALEKLNCTRIVIAHRLSTIKQCDRIIVIDEGKIIEDGTYDELIAKNGFFAELVERQRLDINETD